MRFSKPLLVACAAAACVSCSSTDDSTSQSIDSSAGSNPLLLAGGSMARKASLAGDPDGSGLLAGDYVETTLPNTAFYASMPNASSKPKGVLAQGVVLKVISSEGNFIHVQGMNGETGYVANAAVVPQGLLTSNVPLAPEVPPVVEPQDPEEVTETPEPEIPGLTPPDTSPVPADGTGNDTPAPEPEIPGIEE